MKDARKPVHLYGPSPRHTYTTVCGLNIRDNYKDTTVKRKVTCKRCKKTKSFKDKLYPWKDYEKE